MEDRKNPALSEEALDAAAGGGLGVIPGLLREERVSTTACEGKPGPVCNRPPDGKHHGVLNNATGHYVCRYCGNTLTAADFR